MAQTIFHTQRRDKRKKPGGIKPHSMPEKITYSIKKDQMVYFFPTFACTLRKYENVQVR